jgi:hypothetical protein
LVLGAPATMFGIASHHVRERLIGPLLLSLPWSHCASANATRTRDHRCMPRLLPLPRSRCGACSGLALQLQHRMPSGAMPMLNLAVCPSAACASSSGAKVPRAVAKWAARPSAASAPISGANAASVRQNRIKQTPRVGFMQRSERQGKVCPLCFAHRPNWALQRTLTRSFASATPCGRR